MFFLDYLRLLCVKILKMFGPTHCGMTEILFNSIYSRKLCKITGRRMDDHNFVPLLEFGKRPDCTRCRVTGAGKVRREMPREEEEGEGGELLHTTRDDYKYVAPILRKEVIDKEYQKSFEELQKLLKRLRTSSGEENEKYFV